MGLLDAIFPNSDGGGLLDFLKRNAALQPMPSGLPSDTAQYGNSPAPMNAMAQAPISAPPVPANPPAVIPASGPISAPTPAAANPAVAPAPVALSQPGFMTGYENLRHGGGLIGSLVAGLTGQRNDDAGIALQQQAQTANYTAKALIAKGVAPQVAIAAVQPGNAEMLKTLITQTYGPQTLTNLGQGYVADKNGNVRRAYEPDDTLQVVQTGEDGMGRKTYGVFNKSTGEIKPYQVPGTATGNEGIGDISKSGADYLATLPTQTRDTVKGMLDGTIQPPTSFAMSKPYWQSLIAAAKHADPSFDENNWTARHKMSADIASSGNSSMGGILSNGKSAFGHLAELSDSMSDLGNASHDFTGGGVVAHAQNYVTNAMTPSSATQAKIKAINDNLGHYGQESTKFYSGTGGGVEERMNALKEMNPNSTSSEEMAAYLGKERDLMLQRFREKENQIRTTMGDAYLQQHPVFTPELQSSIAKINANIGKLNGGTPQAASNTPALQEGATATNPKTGQRIVFKGGQWVPLQ